MKSHLILLTFCLFSMGLFAQEQTETTITTETASDSKAYSKFEERKLETFSQRENKTFGFYIGIGGGYSALENFDMINVHARLAFITNRSFEFGFGGEILQSYEANINLNEQLNFVTGAFGGIHLKKIFFGHKKVHFSIPVLAGAGVVAEVNDTPSNIFECLEFEHGSYSPMFFVEPGINIELNISRIIGFEVGAKYRWTSGGILESSINSFDGYTLGGTLKIGLL